jgi:hypothetical protein
MHACVLDRRGRPALRAKKQVLAALSRVTAEFQVAHHRSVSAHRAHADGGQLSATAERSHTICTATANKSQSVTRYTHRQRLTSPASYAACSFAAVAHPRSCLVPAHRMRSLQPCGLLVAEHRSRGRTVRHSKRRPHVQRRTSSELQRTQSRTHFEILGARRTARTSKC